MTNWLIGDKGRWWQLYFSGLALNSVQVPLSLSWWFLLFSDIPGSQNLTLEKPPWALPNPSLQVFRGAPLDILVLSRFIGASGDPSCFWQVPLQFPKPGCAMQEALGVPSWAQSCLSVPPSVLPAQGCLMRAAINALQQFPASCCSIPAPEQQQG